ncbi:MAG: SEC-C domain-containing protein [Chloroflexaceae bacterium]|jgi:hypothetical protein|nr:SEC-C domain-containing protein [Chloroflexaceae bacterium]
MPTVVEKKNKIGRNDPCYCGSGKKYKDCHLPLEQTHRAEQKRLRDAQETLLPKIVEAAQSVADSFPTAMALYWNNKYSADQLDSLDDLEERGYDRFLSWFAFDYRQEDGRTLLEQLGTAAEQGGFEVTPAEQQLLHLWAGVRMRPYLITAIQKGLTLTLRDMLNEQTYLVADHAASKNLAEGEVVVGHIGHAYTEWAAEAPTYNFVGSAAQLTADTAEKLVEYAEIHLADMRRSNPEATWHDFILERSHVLNHFVMALPREARDPTILDSVILQTRVALQITAESVTGLLRRDKGEEPAEPGNAETLAEPAGNAETQRGREAEGLTSDRKRMKDEG